MLRNLNILNDIVANLAKGRVSMNKLILSLTFLALGFLTVLSTINPDASAVWLASPAQAFDVLRSSVMFVLLVLMFTNPPRNVVLRTVVGIAATSFIGWSAYLTYNNTMQILDGIVFLAAGIASLVAVLEFETTDDQIVSTNYKKPVEQ
jgi:hypothetical protein